MSPALIGLGSNLDDPKAHILQAFKDLNALAETKLVASSRLYGSTPLGPQDQPDFVNAAALVKTNLSPLVLLDSLLAIEQQHQRQRLRHWGPRTLDLDLLWFNDQIIQEDRLTVPHPGVTERNFVLLPVQDIAPNLSINGYTLDYWLRQTGQEGIQVLETT